MTSTYCHSIGDSYQHDSNCEVNVQFSNTPASLDVQSVGFDACSSASMADESGLIMSNATFDDNGHAEIPEASNTPVIYIT